MRLVIAQTNPIVGDLEGNIDRIVYCINKARGEKADIIIFPEGVITGYPPQDLLTLPVFVKENKKRMEDTLKKFKDIIVILGFIDYDSKGNVYNAAAIYEYGILKKKVYKTLLPTYDVFDEERYFKAGSKEAIEPVEIKINNGFLKLGVEICEDLWDENYDIKVTDLLVKKGAELVVNISASPYSINKCEERLNLLKKKAVKNNIPMVYVNLVGGQDELVFDGQSLVVDSEGKLIAYGKQFEEDFIVLDIGRGKWKGEEIEFEEQPDKQEKYNALVFGLQEYFRKTGFKRAIMGLSGGIDSSLVACIAVDALGKENVIGLYMPSQYSSDHSRDDANALATNLGVIYTSFSIQDVMEAYGKILEEPLNFVRNYYGTNKEKDDPVADENIQPRIRGNCLMDFSNRLRDLGILVLNTGNKTELALGYCTLYGDLTGGLGVIGDVNKLDVYALSEWVNEKEGKEIIPKRVFKKLPSAELKENQYDPFNFEIVSPLVDEIIEDGKSVKELVKKGYPEDEVRRVYRLIQRAEYKRWQAPPTIKITRKAFGSGRKFPIVNHYKQ